VGKADGQLDESLGSRSYLMVDIVHSPKMCLGYPRVSNPRSRREAAEHVHACDGPCKEELWRTLTLQSILFVSVDMRVGIAQQDGVRLGLGSAYT
jgi:hypothetical protein